MQTFRFRDFTIYKEARSFRKLIRAQLLRFPPEERFRLVDQIHRSCLSIQLNIAEGSAKKSDRDFARFLETALASLNEVIAGFDAAVDDGIITHNDVLSIEREGEKLAKQIGSFLLRVRSTQPIATS